MARGFWTGLLHGAVISAIGLGALSLLAPLPKEIGIAGSEDRVAGDPPESVPEDAASSEFPAEPEQALSDRVPEAETARDDPEPLASDAGAGTAPREVEAGTDNTAATGATTESVTEEGTAEPATAEDESQPQATAIDLPVGSDFGRGGDASPQLPAPLASSPSERSEPSAVSAPASEPAPVAVTGAELPPEAVVPGSELSQSETPETEEGLGFGLPSSQSAPDAPEAPGKVRASGQDSLPASAPAETIAAQPPEEELRPANSSDASVAESEQETTVPDLPSPALDLSTPPDLSDLRALQRDSDAAGQP